MTKQKKPKTGDVVGWLVVEARGGATVEICASRKVGRSRVKAWNSDGFSGWYRLAKIVLAK